MHAMLSCELPKNSQMASHRQWESQLSMAQPRCYHSAVPEIVNGKYVFALYHLEG
jgi:hypothetical protein